MNEKNSLLSKLLDYWDTVLLIVGSVIVILLTELNLIPKEQTTPIILVLVTVIAIHQIRTEIRTTESFAKSQNAEIEAIQGVRDVVVTEIAKINAVTPDLLKRESEIQTSLNRVESSLSSSHRCEADEVDQKNFYMHLITAVESAKYTIDLTQLDALPPAKYGMAEKMRYFTLSNELVRKRPHLRFRRIVAIPNLDKLNWVKELIEEVKDSPNYNMHYVDISSERFFMPPLSLQIVDNTEMCMVDPTRGFLTLAGHDRSLWVKSSSIVGIFSEYYEKFWTLTTPVKEGGVVYWDVLERLENEIRTRETPSLSSTVTR